MSEMGLMSVMMNQQCLEAVVQGILDKDISPIKRTLLFKLLMTQIELIEHSGGTFTDTLKKLDNGKTFLKLVDYLFEQFEKAKEIDRRPKHWLEARLANIKRVAIESKAQMVEPEKKEQGGFKVRINESRDQLIFSSDDENSTFVSNIHLSCSINSHAIQDLSMTYQDG